MTLQQEFNTPQDALAHFGKKGMKWGVTNKNRSASVSVAKRPTGREIKDARLRVVGENVKFHQQRTAIKRGEGTRSEKKMAIKDLRASALKNPDRLTSLRLTKGEKAAFALFAVAAPPAAAAVVGTRVAVKRTLVKAQRS